MILEEIMSKRKKPRVYAGLKFVIATCLLGQY